MQIKKDQIKTHEIIWTDKKRYFGLPISFTKYSLNDETLFINRGLLNLVEDEIKLYRILDLSLTQSLAQRIFGVGTIHVKSSDKTLKDFDIINIKMPKDVKNLLSQTVEAQRELKRVSSREFINDYDEDEY